MWFGAKTAEITNRTHIHKKKTNYVCVGVIGYRPNQMISAPTENGKKVLTMPEYIKRETAIKALMNDAPEQVGYSREDAADCIRYMDAADVAPVRHGRWQAIKSNGIGGTGRCSCCEKAIYGYRAYNYCPNCGAKMDGE